MVFTVEKWSCICTFAVEFRFSEGKKINNSFSFFQKGFVITHDNWPSWGRAEAWAPEIHFVDGTYIVYFSMLKSDEDVRAIGYAKPVNSTDPYGPYEVSSSPIIQSTYGSIDCTWFRDPK